MRVSILFYVTSECFTCNLPYFSFALDPLWPSTKRISLVTTRYVSPPGVCTYISICAMMHHVNTGEAVMTNNEVWYFPARHHEVISTSERVSMSSLIWTLGRPWWPPTECEITWVVTTRSIVPILERTCKSIICLIICIIWRLGGLWWPAIKFDVF